MTRIRSVVLAADGKVSPSSQPAVLTVPKGTIRAAGNVIANGEKTLTEEFKALDSFDLSESRGEVVFSVKREDDFDIGLVAIEGSPISWIPDDPADDVAVQWAPRGSKISYVIRSKFGDVVKTLHIPTAYSFGVDFPFSQIQALGWDPQAERFAVAYSSPVTSDAVDVLKYSGEQRTPVMKPAKKLDASIEPFTGDAILLQRPDIGYDEKLPLVVWVTPERLMWSDARAELMQSARVALVITSKEPDEALWKRAREIAWIDANRAFIVNGERASRPHRPAVPAGRPGDGQDARRDAGAAPAPLVISADPELEAGKYRRMGNVVAVPAAVVESFAARFIAEQLKRTSPPNGRGSARDE